MIRLVSPATLRRLGILGMNGRNITYIGGNNPRRNYQLVDNKLLTKQAAIERSIAVPELYGVIDHQFQIDGMLEQLEGRSAFVIKPVQGSGGKGILVITARDGDRFIKSSGAVISAHDLRRHTSNILAGLHSLGGRNDFAMIEALIDFNPALAEYSYEGVPDIRVIVFRGVPVMAMMRCATHTSDGKANLHQGAVGVGIDIATGRSIAAVQKGSLVTHHPDTGACFKSLHLPDWEIILDLAASCAEMSGLGYLGADIVLDRQRGPMLLELNARPGLAIQVANQEGLVHRLRIAEEIAASAPDHDARIRLAKEHFHVPQGAAIAPP
ncbi:alpha-L-glutamate ligase-like protein [Kineobactrum sediminis]|uniref:alpha-L-glutamate ligase-like protein n=1 Tax=Kineobactrum sediminis TaxID=1905677 RepID=UPI00158AC323|nr:alpha-L-glutamate ligase-like protein [Kineobactrum sediminis]